MMRRMGFPVWAVVLAVGAVFALGVLAAEASHIPGTKKHKIVYHFNGSDDGSHVKKASAVLTNIQNNVDVVGWENIEALELVVHGPGLTPFLKKNITPEVMGKLERLLAGGMKMGACQITMKRQKLTMEDIIEGLPPIPSGVVRVMELQEQGYAYVRP